MSPLRELTLTRVRALLREPEALFWTFGFPILMAIGLGIAFREQPPEPARVGVERGSAAERFLPALRASPEVRARLLEPNTAAGQLRRGELDLVLGGRERVVFRYDPARAESRPARLITDAVLQRAAGAARPVATAHDRERVRGSRYIDWVIPGLIGFNLMSTGMWGIGFSVVTQRQRRQLKQLIATPMQRRDYLLAQVLARLVFLLLEVPPIVLFAWLAFRVEVVGSLLALTLVTLLGALTFAGLGLLCASRVRTIEGVSGLLNLALFPMMVASGVFFSASRFPAAVQPLIQALPLTALNDALRAIYNEGSSLLAVGPELGILVAWTVGSFVLALRVFRWV